MHTNCPSLHTLSFRAMLGALLRLETAPFASTQGCQMLLPRRSSIPRSYMSYSTCRSDIRRGVSVFRPTHNAQSRSLRTNPISNSRSTGAKAWCSSRRAYHSTRSLSSEGTKPKDEPSTPSMLKRKFQEPREQRQPRKKPEGWQIQKRALENKFKEGWNPRKKLSPDALDGIRHLHAQDPQKFSTAVLASEFKVSPEAIRRILKSKWRPNEKQAAERKERWHRRNARIWNQMAELGLRPQRKPFAELSDVNVLNEESRASGSKS